MREPRSITTPLSHETVLSLAAGESVLISGIVFTGRDEAHRRIFDRISSGTPLPFDLRGQVIYYAGPSPAPPGRVTGSAGPTTSGRMDPFTPALLDLGLKGMIGKGSRSGEVVEAMKRNGAVYFGAVGGAAALIAGCITEADIVAWPELGTEAVYRLKVMDFPLIVVIDALGNDLYRTEPPKYRISEPEGKS